MGKFTERLRESGIDFALNAFWVAVWGAVVLVAIAAYGVWQGIPDNYIWLLIGALLALVFVIAITWALVWVKRKKSTTAAPPQGRKGLLNHVIDTKRAMARVNASLPQIARETVKIGKITVQETAKLEAIKRRGGAQVEERAYAQSGRAVRRLLKRTEAMLVHAGLFSSNVDQLDMSLSAWISWLHDRNQPIEGAQEFKQALDSLAAASRSAMPHTVSFRDSVEQNRALNDHFDVLGERLTAVLNTVITSMERTIDLCGRAADKLGAMGAA
jgi:hypothetical protein